MTDEPQDFGIDFDASYIERSAFLGLLLAPVIPEFWAQVLWVIVVSFLAVLHLGIFALVRVGRNPLPRPESSQRRLSTSGQTILILSLTLAWLGSAGLLWTFESFFILTVVIHSLSVTITALIGYD